MEWGSGKDEEDAGKLEHAISIYGRKDNPINSVLDSVPTYVPHPSVILGERATSWSEKGFLWEGNREEH